MGLFIGVSAKPTTNVGMSYLLGFLFPPSPTLSPSCRCSDHFAIDKGCVSNRVKAEKYVEEADRDTKHWR